MQVGYQIVADGLAVTLDGRAARVTWPREIWEAFPGKRAYATELVFLLTSGLAPSSGIELRYGFPRPRFLETYERWWAATLPFLEETLGVDAATLRREHDGIERRFEGVDDGHAPFPETDPRRAILSLTMGKDSLASLVVAQALGLELVGVQCLHPSPAGDHLPRLQAMSALGEQLGVPMASVSDEVRALSKAAPGHRSGIVSSLNLAAYSLLLLPFAAFHRARYLLVGNEQELNHPLRSARSDELVTLSPLQTQAGMGELDAWIGALTSGAVRLTSPIHALHRLAGHGLIHRVRPEVGALQLSCRVATAKRRWCGACKTCAENALFIAAMGRDPTALGLPPMFEEEHRQHFALLVHGLDPRDPYRFLLAEQELLAFAMLAPAGEDNFVQRLVRERHGAGLEADRERLERRYFAPVAPPSTLPLAAEAFACAGRLLARPG